MPDAAYHVRFTLADGGVLERDYASEAELAWLTPQPPDWLVDPSRDWNASGAGPVVFGGSVAEGREAEARAALS